MQNNGKTKTFAPKAPKSFLQRFMKQDLSRDVLQYCGQRKGITLKTQKWIFPQACISLKTADSVFEEKCSNIEI